MEELHLTVSIPEEMGWNRLFHPQLKKRLSFVYRPRVIFLWALGTLVISGSKVLEYYDDFAAGRATVLVKFQQRYQKSHRPVILASLGVHQMLTPLDSLLIRLFDRVQ